MAKTAKKAKEAPVPNADAVRAYAAERRASLAPKRPDASGKRCRELEDAFLDGLRGSWSVHKSAWAAGITEQTAYAWRKASLDTMQEDGTCKDDFCIRWQEAYDVGVASLEDEAIRRAKHGVEKPVYQGGVMVGTVTEYSDTLMGLALRGKNPKTYNTERHEHTGADGKAIEMNMSVTFRKSEQAK